MMATARHIPNCTIADYHQRPEWSRSQVETLRQSPVLFHGRYVANPPLYPFARSDALDIGTVAHECLSNPAGLEAVCIEIPANVLNTQGHRKGAAWQEWSEAHSHLIQLKPEELQPIKTMVRNTYAHPIASKLLAEVLHYEFSLVWMDDDTMLSLRARPDMICAGERNRVRVVDFKTTRSTSLSDFQRDTAKFGYHRQAAWYSDAVAAFGYEVQEFLFISVDKTPAHECYVHRLMPDAIELGRDENRLAWLELARRFAEDDWSNPASTEIHDLDLPQWAYPPLEIVSKGKTLTV